MAAIPQVTLSSNPPCPECGSEMQRRRNKTSGEEFFGCSMYPKCNGTRTKEGLPKALASPQAYAKISRMLKAAVMASEDECLTFSETDLKGVDEYDLNIEAMLEDSGYVITVRKKA